MAKNSRSVTEALRKITVVLPKKPSPAATAAEPTRKRRRVTELLDEIAEELKKHT